MKQSKLDTINHNKKREDIIKDLLPLEGSFSHSFFLTKGLDKALLDSYRKAILYSPKLLCPVLIYRDVFGNPILKEPVPDYQKDIRDLNFPVYFYCNEIGPACLIKEVYFFREAIELLSYLQIQYPISSTILCLSIHPRSPITELSKLPQHFNNARFTSFIPNRKKADILVNLKMSLALANKEHRINLVENKINLIIQGKGETHDLHSINKSIIPFVKRKQRQPLLFKFPPKKYESFNTMLNDTGE